MIKKKKKQKFVNNYLPFFEALLTIRIRLLHSNRDSDSNPRRRVRFLINISLENPPKSPFSEHRIRPEIPGRASQLRQGEHLQVRCDDLAARRHRCPPAASLISRRRRRISVIAVLHIIIVDCEKGINQLETIKRTQSRLQYH